MRKARLLRWLRNSVQAAHGGMDINACLGMEGGGGGIATTMIAMITITTTGITSTIVATSITEAGVEDTRAADITEAVVGTARKAEDTIRVETEEVKR
jgi:hypothetical protein